MTHMHARSQIDSRLQDVPDRLTGMGLMEALL